jgi:HEAT repeat protein
MTADEAFSFLRVHQPLPPTSGISNELIRRFDEVRRFFVEHPDDQCVELLLNSFGEGDGHGVYQLVEDTILAHDHDVVVSALQNSLLSRAGSVRYWSAQIAANYPEPELISPLVQVLTEGNLDERIAAVTALEGIQAPEVVSALEKALHREVEPPVQDLIREVLGK